MREYIKNNILLILTLVAVSTNVVLVALQQKKLNSLSEYLAQSQGLSAPDAKGVTDYGLTQRLRKLDENMGSVISAQTQMQRQINTLQAKIDPSATLSEPKALEEINATRKKQYLMKLKLNKYYQEKKAFPQTIAELEKIAGPIPAEDSSKSKRVSFDRDRKGGWYYSKESGNIEPNL